MVPPLRPLRAVIRLFEPAVTATPGIPEMFTVIVPAVDAATVLVIADWPAVPPTAALMVLPFASVNLPWPTLSAPAAVGR